MKFLLCIVCPPLAVLLTGKPFTSLLTLFLTILGWIPGVVHAFFVVSNAEAEKRNNKLIKAIKERG